MTHPIPPDAVTCVTCGQPLELACAGGCRKAGASIEAARPLAVDLFCGLGGWTEGLLAEGFDVIGFDIEQHIYGEHRYPAQLVIQDVCTLHGSQFRDAALVVASSPCQEFSYRAMPWKRAKALGPPELGMHLFAQAARIQREACEAAGRFIPMVQENVCGAQKWVGRARWHYGSYYLWGDVPALMPVAVKAIKVSTMGAGWYPPNHPKHVPGLGFNTHADRATRQLGDGVKAGDRNIGREDGEHRWTRTFEEAGIKNAGGSWFSEGARVGSVRRADPRDEGRKTVGHAHIRDGHSRTRHLTNQAEHDAVKQGGDWFSDASPGALRNHGSKSSARKAASARIAKIPFALARHIAHVYHPERTEPRAVWCAECRR